MNTTAQCAACHRTRPVHEMEAVMVQTKLGDHQRTMLMSCKDTPTCGERVQHELNVANETREK